MTNHAVQRMSIDIKSKNTVAIYTHFTKDNKCNTVIRLKSLQGI